MYRVMQQPTQKRKCWRDRPISQITPAHIEAYTYKPLPPLPGLPLNDTTNLESKIQDRNCDCFFGMPTICSAGSFFAYQKDDIETETSLSSSKRSLSGAVSTPRRPSHRLYGVSKKKIDQLTGLGVAVTDCQPLAAGCAHSEYISMASVGGLAEAEPCEAWCCQSGHYCRASVEGYVVASIPSSVPPADLIITPLAQDQRLMSVIDENGAELEEFIGSLSQSRLDRDAMGTWNPSTNEFDQGAAREYHLFATHLAKRNGHHVSNSDIHTSPKLRKKRLLFSFTLPAASRFRHLILGH